MDGVRDAALVGYGAAARSGNLGGVLRHYAARITRLGRTPRGTAPLNLVIRHVQLQQAPVRIDRYRIAFRDERNGAARGGFGRNVAHDHAVRSAREPAVGHETDVLGMSFPRIFARGQAEYRGSTYYFFTEDSREAFEADPARYVGSARNS